MPGPRDRSAVPGLDGRLDLGSIWLRGVPGMELRLEVDEPRQKVIAAQLVMGDSQMQVQAFAAPRSAGIWDEIRDEIAQSLATGGGTAEEVEGRLGPELHVRVPSKAANGRTVFSPVRFVGVDGPRWFFRAVMSGRAAIDDGAAAPFFGLLDEIVVVRGDAPMAPVRCSPSSCRSRPLARRPPRARTRRVLQGPVTGRRPRARMSSDRSSAVPRSPRSAEPGHRRHDGNPRPRRRPHQVGHHR